MSFGIRVYKQYCNFASAHFLIFEKEGREPLHGHNYRVSFEGKSPIFFHSQMIFDFLDIKPLLRQICEELNHKILLPKENKNLRFIEKDAQLEVFCRGDFFSFPKKDCLLLPLENISAECLAEMLHFQLKEEVSKKFNFWFKYALLEVEETVGQSAYYEEYYEDRGL